MEIYSLDFSIILPLPPNTHFPSFLLSFHHCWEDFRTKLLFLPLFGHSSSLTSRHNFSNSSSYIKYFVKSVLFLSLKLIFSFKEKIYKKKKIFFKRKPVFCGIVHETSPFRLAQIFPATGIVTPIIM